MPSRFLPDDRRLLVPVKLNVAAPPPVLAFSASDMGLTWEDDPVDGVDLDAILQGAHEVDQATERRDAESFLRGLLADGNMAATDILAEAKANGITPRTLKRAKAKLGVISKRKRYPGTPWAWYWSLPTTGTGRGPE